MEIGDSFLKILVKWTEKDADAIFVFNGNHQEESHVRCKILVLAGALSLWNCSGDDTETEEPVASNEVSMEAPNDSTNDMGMGNVSQPGSNQGGSTMGGGMNSAAAAAAAANHNDSQVLWVNVSALNVRSGAGMSHRVIRHVREGEQVRVHERVGVWAKIGPNEWVSSRYLRDQP